jgi:hypothetical protein
MPSHGVWSNSSSRDSHLTSSGLQRLSQKVQIGTIQLYKCLNCQGEKSCRVRLRTLLRQPLQAGEDVKSLVITFCGGKEWRDCGAGGILWSIVSAALVAVARRIVEHGRDLLAVCREARLHALHGVIRCGARRGVWRRVVGHVSERCRCAECRGRRRRRACLLSERNGGGRSRRGGRVRCSIALIGAHRCAVIGPARG